MRDCLMKNSQSHRTKLNVELLSCAHLCKYLQHQQQQMTWLDCIAEAIRQSRNVSKFKSKWRQIRFYCHTAKLSHENPKSNVPMKLSYYYSKEWKCNEMFWLHLTYQQNEYDQCFGYLLNTQFWSKNNKLEISMNGSLNLKEFVFIWW